MKNRYDNFLFLCLFFLGGEALEKTRVRVRKRADLKQKKAKAKLARLKTAGLEKASRFVVVTCKNNKKQNKKIK